MTNTTRPISADATWGEPSLEPDGHIAFYFIGTIEPLQLPVCKRYVLGRADADNGAENKVDLDPYGAAHKGVSRAHAALEMRISEVTLTDLGSTNGTYLNNQPLQPRQTVGVRSGDQIRVGELIGYIYFSKAALNGS
jgi:hypothetical protein